MSWLNVLLLLKDIAPLVVLLTVLCADMDLGTLTIEHRHSTRSHQSLWFGQLKPTRVLLVVHHLAQEVDTEAQAEHVGCQCLTRHGNIRH